MPDRELELVIGKHFNREQIEIIDFIIARTVNTHIGSCPNGEKINKLESQVTALESAIHDMKVYGKGMIAGAIMVGIILGVIGAKGWSWIMALAPK